MNNYLSLILIAAISVLTVCPASFGQEVQTSTTRQQEEILQNKIKSLRDLLGEQEERIAELETKQFDRPIHPEVLRLRKVVKELKEENQSLKHKTKLDSEESNKIEKLKTRINTKSDTIQKLQSKIDETESKLEHYQRLSQKREEELRAMEEELEEVEEIEAQQEGEFMRITLEEAILFDAGKAQLRETAHSTLNHLIEVANTYSDYIIQVEGHTDDVPLSDSHRFNSNWELSVMRAVTVVSYIEENSDIDMKRVVSAGYGPYRPLVSNDSPKNRKKNRRVEISLYPPEFLEQTKKGVDTTEETQ
ncbi:MAG: OmpA family protein [bacterium]